MSAKTLVGTVSVLAITAFAFSMLTLSIIQEVDARKAATKA